MKLPGSDKKWTWFILLSGFLFFIVALRAYTVPFSHDEAATFFFYVQSNNYLPFVSFVYTNNHFLNSLLSNIFYHLAGSHRFILRLPNVLSFLVLCFGVYRMLRQTQTTSAKTILISFFLLNLNFLELFEMCRGYGLSMAFLILALSYVTDYFKNPQIIKMILFSFLLQLSISANLTLIVISGFIFMLVALYQFRHHLLFKSGTLILHILNGALLYFWLKLSLFYKNAGVLDSGTGEGYWKITFVSLMEFMMGNKSLWMQGILVFLFVILLLYGIQRFIKSKFYLPGLFEEQGFYFVLFLVLTISSWLQKKLLGVNYPEDRTGLFFYVLFSLSIVFTLDAWNRRFGIILALPFVLYFSISSAITFNLGTFHYYFYQVFPKQFYVMLQDEQKKSHDVLTIGGNPGREMVYAFMNYRGGGNLDPMDSNPYMQMNCDYYIASRWEAAYYNKYYTELSYDAYWDRALLKRRNSIERKAVWQRKDLPLYYKGNEEFYELFRLDSVELNKLNSLEAEVDIFFKKVPAPFRSFLVFSLNDENGNQVYYERALLNWLSDDLSGISKKFRLPMGKAPKGKSHLIVYLWNIEKKTLDFSLLTLKINELHGEGVNESIPEEYYPALEKCIQKPIL